MRKCFDPVSPELALACWKQFGAPEGVLHVLSQFYKDKNRWFAVRGNFHPEPIQTTISLLQGCPASPALLNALMTVWVRYVQIQSPQTKLAVYLDDRTMWDTGHGCVKRLVDAMEAAAAIDAVLGFTLHPDKLECFASKPTLRVALSRFAHVLGPVATEFKLLGIHYFIGSRKTCLTDTKLQKAILARTHRIRLVTKNFHIRIRLVQILVISMIRWTGPWQRFTVATLRGWGSAVETAIWGSKACPGRSPYLFWAVVAGIKCHPAAALDLEALKVEWRRRTCLFAGIPTIGRASKQAQAVMQRIHWTFDDEGVWTTPYGQLRSGWTSAAKFQKYAEMSWLRHLFNKDT